MGSNHLADMTNKPGAMQMIEVGEGAARRRIAYRFDAGDTARPTIVWLGGLRSDMQSTKASALAEHCATRALPYLRFDYSGHGASEGTFAQGTMSRWLEEALAIVTRVAPGPLALVGSSLGGYVTLLLARALGALGQAERLRGMVLIAPAVDMTERLMWAAFPEAVKARILGEGRWDLPSAYGLEPTPITRGLIEDGRGHLLLGAPIRTFCPTIVLQGADDPDVPLAHTLETMKFFASDPVTLMIVADGDHRLSRPQDIALLCDALDRVYPP